MAPSNIDATKMGDDELVQAVVGSFTHLRDAVPYIVELRRRFHNGETDDFNRLVEPIADCRTWKEFCERHLNRQTSTIRMLLGSSNPASTDKKAKLKTNTNERVEKHEGRDIRTCTLTFKNIGDTRCLSMAEYRLNYTEAKIHLLVDALKNAPSFNHKRQEIKDTLKIYLQAYQNFENKFSGGIDFIEKALIEATEQE